MAEESSNTEGDLLATWNELWAAAYDVHYRCYFEPDRFVRYQGLRTTLLSRSLRPLRGVDPNVLKPEAV